MMDCIEALRKLFKEDNFDIDQIRQLKRVFDLPDEVYFPNKIAHFAISANKMKSTLDLIIGVYTDEGNWAVSPEDEKMIENFIDTFVMSDEYDDDKTYIMSELLYALITSDDDFKYFCNKKFYDGEYLRKFADRDDRFIKEFTRCIENKIFIDFEGYFGNTDPTAEDLYKFRINVLTNRKSEEVTEDDEAIDGSSEEV